jgi:nucleoside-diphosphate-sugar epimerase
VNVSSQSVYGNGTDRSEAGCLDAIDAYAFSKIAIEECVRGVARRKPSTAAVSLRLARLFGPAAGLRASEFPHRVVVSALQDVAVEVTRPDDVLDLIDIRDAVRALEFFVGRRNPEWRGDAINVGSGRAVTAGEFASMVDRTSRERLARPLRLTMGGVRAASRPPLDCARIHKAGWSPAISIEQSVSDLFGYLGDAS